MLWYYSPMNSGFHSSNMNSTDNSHSYISHWLQISLCSFKKSGSWDCSKEYQRPKYISKKEQKKFLKDHLTLKLLKNRKETFLQYYLKCFSLFVIEKPCCHFLPLSFNSKVVKLCILYIYFWLYKKYLFLKAFSKYYYFSKCY